MKQKQIRVELLDEHADLRRRIGEARVLVQNWVHGKATRADVRSALMALGTALQDHNQNEERLLEDIVPTIDALGPARLGVMNDRHIEEHHELYGALIVAAESPTAAAAAPLLQFLFGRVLDHMDHEEEAFLGRGLLVDAVIPR